MSLMAHVSSIVVVCELNGSGLIGGHRVGANSSGQIGGRGVGA